MEDLILVDTCKLFDFMAEVGKREPFETALLEAKVALSAITVYELFRGVDNSLHIDQRTKLVGLCKVLDITEPISKEASKIYTSLKKKGELIPNEDILIAATAIHWKYPLLTSNRQNFSRVPNLNLLES